MYTGVSRFAGKGNHFLLTSKKMLFQVSGFRFSLMRNIRKSNNLKPETWNLKQIKTA